jgi:hypothetical protein
VRLRSPQGGKHVSGGVHAGRGPVSCVGSPAVKGKWWWSKLQPQGQGHHSAFPMSMVSCSPALDAQMVFLGIQFQAHLSCQQAPPAFLVTEIPTFSEANG